MAEETSQANTETTTKSSEPTKKSNKTLWIVLAVVFVVLFVIPGLLLTIGGVVLKRTLNSDKAGEKITESIIEKATGGKVDVDSKEGNFSVKSEDGNSSLSYGDNQELPKDFPKNDIAYIAEKSVTFVITSENEGKKTWSITTTVDKTFNDAVEYFEGKIKSPEYSEVSNFAFGESKTFYGTNSKYGVSITVTKPDSGDVTVSYIVTEEM